MDGGKSRDRDDQPGLEDIRPSDPKTEVLDHSNLQVPFSNAPEVYRKEQADFESIYAIAIPAFELEGQTGWRSNSLEREGCRMRASTIWLVVILAFTVMLGSISGGVIGGLSHAARSRYVALP